MSRVVVIGTGGREAAIAKRIKQDPGNQVAMLAASADIPSDTDLIVVGPEQPLVDGKAKEWRNKGFPVVGPDPDGADIEGSKIMMKQLLLDAGVRSANFVTYRAVTDLPMIQAFIKLYKGRVAIKTSGLAAGKGVYVARGYNDAMADVHSKISGESFGEAGKTLVVEEALNANDPTAYEISLIVVTNGKGGWRLLPVARDYKPLNDKPGAPNTGGMGSYSPVNTEGDQSRTDAFHRDIANEIVPPVLKALIDRGIDYRGFLYFGLMVTAKGVFVLEINIRSGDPETQVMLPRIQSSLTDLLMAAAKGEELPEVVLNDACFVCLVLAAPGYPDAPVTGRPIRGLELLDHMTTITVYQPGTKLDDDGQLVVSGGRFLNVVAGGATVADARARAYNAASLIQSEGMQVHSGIAAAA